MNTKTRSFLIFGLTLLTFAPVLVSAPSAWQKFVSSDKTFSFHYPRGWKVEAKESTIEITNAAAGEQILVVALPYDKAKTPTDSAKFLIDALRASSSPDILASNWESNEASRDTAVSCEVSYSDSGKSYESEVLVIKDDGAGQVLWFSFSGVKAGYSRPRALAILQGLVSSLAKGADSAPPGEALPALGPIDRNGRAFMFVLEFALGAPLTGGQEEVVLSELRKGWETRSGEELRKYDAYPKIVESITHAADQKALDSLRRELEKTTREWLETSDPNDPAVAVVAAQLRQKGKVLVSGDPALTVMAADAYSEMYVYSKLLERIPNAMPDQVSPAAVAEVKGRLLKAWSAFSAEERGQVSRTPGLWVSLRSVLRYGSPAEQTQVRAALSKVAALREGAAAQSPASRGSGQSSGQVNIVGNLIKHQVLMNIQQMTFNNYLYCHGFKSSIF